MEAATAWKIAVVGAGPVGLSLALHAASSLPRAQVALFDARTAQHDVSGDPRTLALSLGSVQLLKRLRAWPEGAAEPITAVHVSQVPPSLEQATVTLAAADEGVPMLGAVLAYGTLVAALQRVWFEAAAADAARLSSRFGTPVASLKNVADGVEVDAGIAETFDLVVVAEGGVFSGQVRKALAHDYQQTAWVGTVELRDGVRGMAFERFTRHGPVALLPLPPKPGSDAALRRAALVWCVETADDPVRPLSAEQRAAVLNTVFPPEVGTIMQVSPLKDFALGLNAERSLVAGRQVRIGNAAQTLHPVAGQGLNLGLRDAFELVQALRFAQDLDAALKRVEWSRAPDRWAMIATTDFLARSFTWRLPGLALARGLALAALQGVPPLKSLLARQMMFGRR